MPAIPRAAPAPTLLAAALEVAVLALVAEALLALLEDVILAAEPLDELALEAEPLLLALEADVALTVTELEPEEEAEPSETVPPKTELGLTVLAAEPDADL